MRISVIGCGYLGAVHAVAMTELGHDVVGIDVDATRIASLSEGTAPFFEPELDPLLKSALQSGRLRFSTVAAAASDADVHFLAVGTPQKPDSHSADLTFVDAAFAAVAAVAKPGSLIAGKSTVPVGTAERLAKDLATLTSEVSLAWNPEFLREGFAVRDTLEPDRIVYGVETSAQGEKDVAKLDAVYHEAIKAGTPRLITNFATSELVKVSANAFLATKISFINAIGEIADITGADITELADAIGHDVRIGRRFLNAGVGFGGGCLPKDIRAFAARAEELGRASSLAFLNEVDAINLRQRQRVVDLAVELLGGSVNQRRVAILGVAFKPNSDDVRDSPALAVAVQLKGLGADVVATDPEGIDNARRQHPQLSYEPSVESALDGAELVILVTEWQEYREIDPVSIGSIVAGRIIIDGRNALDPSRWRESGWTYRGLGRP
ncbi:UDP-glucose/GDP-mannose dehydrogenase family protein [Leucobacter sp. wl10]|uniref:UDP-glucose dehydrogenase family protein n=1 Tax=Leucobacter sp. wl10 TaxID=2304677 RepID=UPI000E5AE755|nr:UDP-glucose/GDP-mannose dehydrogenase family protein [Leucobacter sp. wl10]RGE19787.1 UDP-glucose/GDP-mannose dehydrogenase family protein [Leucobacter sp. wl10]